MDALGTPLRSRRRRAFALGALMAGAAALAQWRQPTRRAAHIGTRMPLAQVFPPGFAGWNAAADTQAVVRPLDDQGKAFGLYSDLVERVYVSPEGRQLMLSAAYGEEQSPSLQVHKPESCYPTAGFTISALHKAALPVGGATIPVTRLRAVMLQRREAVTYWVVLGDEVQADDLSFRDRQRSFGARGLVLDGMLVRVSSIDADAERAYRLHEAFAQALAGALAPAERARVFGSLTPARPAGPG